MNYFIAGPSGVGKTFFSKKISDNYDVQIYDTGPILRNFFQKLNLNVSFSEWIKYNENKYGNNFAISIICSEISPMFNDTLANIIVGNRCIEGINYMVEHLPISDYCIVYLDADFKCLKTNYETREKIELTDEEFMKIFNGGVAMGLDALKQYVKSNSINCFYYYKHKNDDYNCIGIYEEIKRKTKKR